MDVDTISAWVGNPKEGLPLNDNSQVPCTQHRTRSGRKGHQALLDFYRCPDSAGTFEVCGNLSSDLGYFQFGPDAVCYGRSCAGSRQSGFGGDLHDLLEHIEEMDATLKLPFCPTEIIDNLRLERYLGKPSSWQTFLRKMYYAVRPLTTLSFRKQVQQLYAHNWRRRQFPHWPVDTTVENLCDRILLLSMQAKGVTRTPFVWFWPSGARGCVTMTHDVETVAGRDSCRELMDLDDAAGIKASFQIVPEKRYGVPEELLASIRERGFEIAIQDLNHDGRLYDSHEGFVRRAEIINRYGREYGARGFRAAVLYRKPEWYDALDFDFDMSIPNVAHLDPQRGGCCTVMPFFIGNVLELPVTTTQDYTLFYLLKQRSIDLWKTQTELILGKNGLVSFIVHPDYLANPAVRCLYEKLLEYLRAMRKRENLWLALPSEIDHWWRERSRMSVVYDGRSYRIEGEGADRARLAFATNVNGRLVYEFDKTPGAC